MAIRIRKVDGKVVALCAAETKEQDGDLYLDDNIHHALSNKFTKDFKSMGFLNDGQDIKLNNAAPYMLETLMRLNDFFVKDGNVTGGLYTLVDAAIKKATE